MGTRIMSKGVLLCGVALIALAVHSAKADDQGQISEIIVTANKHAEKLHDVAEAVSAITGADMAQRGETDFRDFAAEIPGFQIQETGPILQREILRGQNSGGSGATVATIIDDMPLSFSGSDSNASLTSTNIDTYDLQRIEVLKGPQGTLYGATAEGGVVKYVTNAPNLSQYQAGIEASGYNVAHGESSGSVKGFANIPLVDGMAALRVTGIEEGIAGYIDNPLLNEKNVNSGSKTSGRASLLLAPTDDLSIRLTASQQLIHVGGLDQVEAVGAGMVPAAPAPANQLDLAQGYVDNSNYRQTQDSRIAYYYGDVDYDLGWANLTSVTSYGTVKANYITDFSYLNAAPGLSYGDYLSGALGTPLALRQTQLEEMSKESQEVRLASAPGQKLFGNDFEWIVGAFATREYVTFSQNFDFTAPASSDTLTSLGIGAGGTDQLSRYQEWAVFGQVDYHVLPDVDVAAGIRRSGNQQSLTATFDGGVLVGPSPTVGPLGSNEHSTTWSVAPRWHLSDDTLLYSRIATGFRPGGPNLAIPNQPAGYPVNYGSDSTYNYEVGAKSYLFDRTVDFDIAAYDIEWSHIQIITVVNTDTGPYSVTGNVGAATSRGLEWTVGWSPLSGLRLSDNGAYTDAHLTQDAPLLGGMTGDVLAYVPHWSNNLNIDYEWPVFSDFSAFAGGSWTFTGSRYGDFAPAGTTTEDHPKLPSYSSFNLQLGVKDKAYTLELYGRNITDEKGISSYNNMQGYNETGLLTLIQPRTIGLRVAATY
jgi:outer membrane receptor protein involved in Fe transport